MTSAADVIADVSRGGSLEVASKGPASDLVTAADRAAEAHIVERIRTLRPHDAVVGEEGHAISGTSGVTWIIDPLDGTTNFVHRLPPHGVSVAAWWNVHDTDGDPIAAALLDITREELFSAARGAGATLNGVPIGTAVGPENLATAIVGTGFAHEPEVRLAEIDLLHRVLPRIGDLRRSGAGAFDLCWVALGRLDAFYQAGLKLWDYAGAQLVLTESGGDFALLPELAGSGPVVLGSAASIHTELTALLRTSPDARAGSIPEPFSPGTDREEATWHSHSE